MDKDEKMKKFFPEYFNLFIMPEGAKEEKITAYRACKSWKCDKESFTPTYEELGLQCIAKGDSIDPSLFSLSLFEKPKDVKRFAMMDENHPKPHKIAIGITEPECGPVQRTRERKGKSAKSHVDWWLYVGAEPYKHFSIIDNFDEYYEKYKQA